MVLFVEKGNELFFEVLLCERRHEVKGIFGEIVTRGIFPTTVGTNTRHRWAYQNS